MDIILTLSWILNGRSLYKTSNKIDPFLPKIFSTYGNLIQWPLRWRQHVMPKRRDKRIHLRGVITPKTNVSATLTRKPKKLCRKLVVATWVIERYHLVSGCLRIGGTYCLTAKLLCSTLTFVPHHSIYKDSRLRIPQCGLFYMQSFPCVVSDSIIV